MFDQELGNRFAATTTLPATVERRARPTIRPAQRRPRARATYVRRRLVVAVLAVALVVVMAQAGAALGSVSLAAPERRPASRPTEPVVTVTVAPGDSLWSIAEKLAPDEDPRVIVDELDQARHGAPLVPGETITWAG
jgi:hypothetical protein